jgi:uncharacterized protein (DUF1697 family)
MLPIASIRRAHGTGPWGRCSRRSEYGPDHVVLRSVSLRHERRRHRLSNDELRAHFVAMGFTDVATFRASGNVVFAGESRPSDEVRERIEEGLAPVLGYAVPTFVRTAAEVHAIAAAIRRRALSTPAQGRWR